MARNGRERHRQFGLTAHVDGAAGAATGPSARFRGMHP